MRQHKSVAPFSDFNSARETILFKFFETTINMTLPYKNDEKTITTKRINPGYLGRGNLGGLAA
jgi:hypothetical protein